MNGNYLDYFFVFISGVFVSFTPCIYPVIPLILSFIAGMNTQGSRLMGFVISLVYVLGLAITYSFLAVFAALSGKIFGSFQNYPWTFIAVGNVLLFFSLVMFDVIPLRTWGLGQKNQVRPRNLWAVLLIGMSSGLVIGPCTTPVLGSLLIYISGQNHLLRGIALTLVFSSGMGASLILIGTFGGLLSSLPRSGPWMVWIKKLCGTILLFAAEYYFFKAGSLFYN